MKRNINLTVDSCKKALEKQLNESEQTDIIYVDGIAVKNVQNMTADEYARSIGATPIEETTFGKRFGWTKNYVKRNGNDIRVGVNI